MAALRRSPQFAGQSLGDDADRPDAEDLRPGEVAPGDEAGAGGVEIAGRNVVVETHGGIIAGVVLAFDEDLVPARFGSAHGNGRGEAGGRHAGNCSQLVEDAVLHAHDGRVHRAPACREWRGA